MQHATILQCLYGYYLCINMLGRQKSVTSTNNSDIQNWRPPIWSRVIIFIKRHISYKTVIHYMCICLRHKIALKQQLHMIARERCAITTVNSQFAMLILSYLYHLHKTVHVTKCLRYFKWSYERSFISNYTQFADYTAANQKTGIRS